MHGSNTWLRMRVGIFALHHNFVSMLVGVLMMDGCSDGDGDDGADDDEELKTIAHAITVLKALTVGAVSHTHSFLDVVAASNLRSRSDLSKSEVNVRTCTDATLGCVCTTCVSHRQSGLMSFHFFTSCVSSASPVNV
eukprot:TRINITY_DN15646_c0_g1_i2.p1 TRINITY_DN15646_c0_g1~~TRINITY_DN15646_c0_g1_i2.p1  ORF type:complete len:137 (-),score=21.47 TRINITY_DN15646_c0_g1_i2:39-449(-)